MLDFSPAKRRLAKYSVRNVNRLPTSADKPGPSYYAVPQLMRCAVGNLFMCCSFMNHQIILTSFVLLGMPNTKALAITKVHMIGFALRNKTATF